MRAEEPYDLLVVGGGVNGAASPGTPRAAAFGRCWSRRTTSLQGTSSRSGKLIHGGPALPRVLRVPPGARGADRARGAAAQRAAHRLADALRAAPQPGAAPALARTPGPLPLRPSRRPRAPARHAQPRPPARPGRRADPAGVHARLRLFRLLGGRFPPRRSQRRRRRPAGRRDPDPHGPGLRPARRTLVAGRDPRRRDGRKPGGRGPCDRQRDRPLGGGRDRPQRREHRAPGAPRQGKPPRPAKVLGRATGLPVPERRRAGDLRKPLRGRPSARRHHGRAVRRRGRRRRRRRRTRRPIFCAS